jgi:hypothetical protein
MHRIGLASWGSPCVAEQAHRGRQRSPQGADKLP